MSPSRLLATCTLSAVIFLVALVIVFNFSTLLVETQNTVDVAYAYTSSPEAEPVVEFDKNKQTDVLLFLGDIMLARGVERTMQKYGSAYPFRYTSAITASATAVVANFESAMNKPHESTPSLAMRFSADEQYLPILSTYGITHASLANNHSLDYGATGELFTRAALQKVGIRPFGTSIGVSSSTVTYLDHNGLRIGVVGIHTLFSEPTSKELTAVFAEVSKYSDKQIAYLHWGTEYTTLHTSDQEVFARKLIAAGADLIIGSHPHVAEDIQLIDGVPVVYSLGNFIFDQYFSHDVQEGFAVAVTLTPTSDDLVIRPHRLYAHTQPHLMTATDSTAFLTNLASRSDIRLRDEIMAQHITF